MPAVPADSTEDMKPHKRRGLSGLLSLRFWRKHGGSGSTEYHDSAYDSSSDTGVLEVSVGSDESQTAEKSFLPLAEVISQAEGRTLLCVQAQLPCSLDESSCSCTTACVRP